MHNNLKNKKELGASMLEFAIALMLFIPLLLAIIDWGRYMSVQGTLNKAANHGLTVAQTISGLEKKYDADTTIYDAAVAKIEEEAARFTDSSSLLKSGGMSSIDQPLSIKLPSIGPGQNLNSAFLTTPIVVTTSAKFKFFFPFVNDKTIVGRAVGFREPRFVISSPILVDCMGNPNNGFGYNAYCPCPPGQAWRSYSGGFCQACDPGRVVKKGECVCDNSVPCSGQLRRDVKTCQCACTIDNGSWNEAWDEHPDKVQQGDQCVCPSGTTMDSGGTCQCNNPPSCSGGKILGPDCTCICGGGNVWYAPLSKCVTPSCAAKPGCPQQNCVACGE